MTKLTAQQTQDVIKLITTEVAARITAEVTPLKEELTKALADSIEKDKKITELTARIDALEKNAGRIGGTNVAANEEEDDDSLWSSVLKRGAKKNNEVIMMAKIANEQREKSRKENNIVISGVAECTDQNKCKAHDEKVNLILDKHGLSRDDVKNQTRLKKKRTTVSSTTTTADSNASPSLILLEFNSIGNQQTAIRNSNELRQENDFKKVYINPDKTLNERILDKKLREVRNDRNSKFTSVHSDGSGRHYTERNGKKLYWGIRSGQLQLVECH
jgi:hypothetical protein